MAGKTIIRFIVLLLLQVLVFNNVDFNSYVYPAFYVYFILLLPFETAGWLLLLSSFLMGLSVDFFTNSLGINAAASTFTAFLRPALFKLLKSKKEYVPGITPGIKDLGFRWFFAYALILIFAHHSVLFFLEIFNFNDALQTIHRIIASSVATIILVLLTQAFFNKKEK
ncbi:MAG: rod shape-determining protein MreD [Bacteroidales bacterium]|nr:rod shape-determining protein MreD [Bacteroidales bacterium]